MASKVKIIFCRAFQAVMKIGNYFLPYRIPKVTEGRGSVLKVPEMIRKAGLKRVLLVTDAGIMKLGLAEGLTEQLKQADISCTVFDAVQPNPTDEDVEAGLKLYRENHCEGIIAFGGGSPMDCAKGIAARIAHPKKSIRQLQGIIKVHKKIVPLFAVPTTSGTGSETTVAAVLTVKATHHKASINDPVIMPHYAVLDPELTKGLPPFITATTGMDALSHAIESYTNWTYCTRLEKNYARKAVKLIHQYLLKAYEDGNDLKARQAMQKAAFYAGRSFTRGCVGNVHAVGHTLGGLYGVPHGLAMSVILPHVLKMYGPASYRRLAELAGVCGIPGASDKEKAEAFISWIEEMNRKMGIPEGFDVIREEDIPKIIRWADKEANPLYPVPMVFGRIEFRELIERIRL